jgi:hypothetical protein
VTVVAVSGTLARFDAENPFAHLAAAHWAAEYTAAGVPATWHRDPHTGDYHVTPVSHDALRRAEQ